MRCALSRGDWSVGACCLLVLSALAAPAIQQARDESRERACQDRLRHLAAAFDKYTSLQGGLPPRRTGFNDGNPYGGWGSHLTPYLPQTTVAQDYDLRYDFFDPHNKSVTESPLTPFLCPSSPEERFVLIQSQASTKALNPDKDTVFSCRAGVSDFIASNGVQLPRNGYGIHALGADTGIGNERQPMTDNSVSSLAKITDGLSNTLLLIEQAGRPAAWRKSEQKPGAGQFGVSPNARGAWAGWGSIAFGAANSDTGETPGRGDATDCAVNCNNWFGIYGFHQGGANVLFCDGSIRFVGRKLDPLTFAYLTVRDDGRLIDLDDLFDE